MPQTASNDLVGMSFRRERGRGARRRTGQSMVQQPMSLAQSLLQSLLQTLAQRRCAVAAAVGSALLLAGCADAGIDLNGKFFDYLGISPAAQEARRYEPQVAERAPLVMPPNYKALPLPGSGQAPAPQLAWPDDPDQRKVREAKERERLHMAYCRGELQWKEKALNREEVGAPRSPYGPCPTLFSGAEINKDKE